MTVKGKVIQGESCFSEFTLKNTTEVKAFMALRQMGVRKATLTIIDKGKKRTQHFEA